jgi:hypothetical protein
MTHQATRTEPRWMMEAEWGTRHQLVLSLDEKTGEKHERGS